MIGEDNDQARDDREDKGHGAHGERPASNNKQEDAHEDTGLQENAGYAKSLGETFILERVGDDRGTHEGMSELCEEGEHEQEGDDGEEHGEQLRPSLRSSRIRPTHSGTQGAGHHKDAARCEDEMRGTEYLLSADLEAKKGVPDHVANATKSKEGNAYQ